MNKGEARNALARAIFFCQLGELRDRTFENQAYRASGLNLIVAAVILWNTRYLELAAADLGVGPDTMRHAAPLGWEHLSLTGDYAWDSDKPAGARRVAAAQNQTVAPRGMNEKIAFMLRSNLAYAEVTFLQ